MLGKVRFGRVGSALSSAARPLSAGAPRLTGGPRLTGCLAPASSVPCTRLATVSRSSTPRNQRDARRRLDPTLPEGAVPSETGLLGPLEVKAISEALGIRPTKVLGQNFVHDAGTVRKIVAAGGVEEGDEVVEVGPGLGSLTLALLEVGARVRAVEIDPPLARDCARPHGRGRRPLPRRHHGCHGDQRRR